MSDRKHVLIYTDGGSLGNPGPGGYGAVVIYKDKRKEITGGFRLTTNNRMEITAAIEGLSTLKENCKVTLYTDSQYLVNSIMKGWAKKWKSNGWKRNKKDKAVNVDLWEKLLALLDKHDVEFKWLKGHAGHIENELCDKLSKQSASSRDLPVDPGYKPDEV
ncbi:MAG: ribonuclease HI [Bacteroidota bacterium]|nr:ribonuclease HI [Bacteroidota bacterium]MDP4196865.1 ribonuclease HI [Bacteroidota bacterium]